MKLIILLVPFFFLLSFALVDTDSDWVIDDRDICPRVYARSENWCPSLAPVIGWNSIDVCLTDQLKKGKTIAIISPICDSVSKTCPRVSNILGIQSCDTLFPVIFDEKTWFALVRWSIYIVDFTK